MKKKVHLLGIGQKWTLKWDFFYISKILQKNNIEISRSKFAINSKVYLANRYQLKKSFFHLFKNKVYFDFFHGHPSYNKEFKKSFMYIIKNQTKFSKIRVSNKRIFDLFSDYGLNKKIKKINIAVDNKVFKKISDQKRLYLRKQFKIPKKHIIIGSFQKDGEGWGQGNNPKMIKGPDIFVKTLKILKKKFPKILVILLGPSRGFVKQELKKNQIKFLHFYTDNYYEICKYYNLLDLYLISSREEGGPKSLLESMACEIPVVSTPVGQAKDLIENNKNALIINNFSPRKLARECINILENKNLKNKIVFNGKKTSMRNDWTKQEKDWVDFFDINQ